MGPDSDLLNEFISEAKAHIATIEAGLLQMEEGEADDDGINALFRAAHSIKGTASFFELHKIVELSHCIESLFGELRDRRLEVKAEMVDSLLATTDMLKELISNPACSESYPITDQVASINRFLAPSQRQPSQASRSADTPSAWSLWDQLSSGDERNLPESAAPSEDSFSSVAEQKESLQARNALPVIQPEASVPDGKHHAVIMEDSVRVNVSLLNDLLILAGEMVLRRNQLLRIAQDSERQAPQLEMLAKSIDELTTNLQKKVMKTRMQPISNIFNKFPRIVRDLSRKVGKEVDLSIQGMNVELDRSLIETLLDPMIHLVRNALDHGIELPEVRERSNKPLTGSLVLRAYHESGRVIVEICDDGAGIDLEKIKSQAVQKGLVGEKEISSMREADIMNLILAPGFSTAERVTDLSGRGVGMDVVKTNVEKLGGKIEIVSELGTGTTFRLILPLTLAIISSLIVVANGQSFVIPQANVRELLLIQPGDTSGNRVEELNKRLVLRLRGRLLPLIRLSELLNDDRTRGTKADDDRFIAEQQILRVLVVKAGNKTYGLIVDSIYDTEEILVKPLSTILGNCGLYSGVTVLGDGSIAMILDTESLPLRAGLSVEEDKALPSDEKGKSIDEKQYLLLFRCSGGEMLGLDLAMVSRVEAIDVSRLQKIGSKYYFTFQGQTIRVIRPEHYLPISRKKNAISKIYVILPKLVKHSVGIIAEQICDTMYTTVSLDKDGVRGTGILGSALINNTVVTLLNLHELFAEAVPEYYYQESRRNRFHTSGCSGIDKEGRKRRILLAEDVPFFLKVVTSYLESEGYEVIPAENGREALEILLKTKVDIVVSDIEMPLMTGIELVRAIRSNESLRHLPVIALTSLTGETNKEKGLRAGFDVYEYKLDRTRLLDSIRTCSESRYTPEREVK